MRNKPIKIDWADLEEAFSNPSHDEEAFLDRITGHVALRGEGSEDDDLDDDESAFTTAAAVANVARSQRRDDPTRVRIVPPDTPLKVEWLKAFMAGRDDDEHAAINAELREAMEGDTPAESIRAVLNANTDDRDAWYIYRSEQISALIDRWLSENEIQIVDVPPWRA
jgi:hypothetical protein